MKILVTGGAGFIGSNFILYWLEKHKEDKIVNLDKLTYAGNLENLKSIEANQNYEFLKGDICDASFVEKATEGIDTVVHFAAESHVDRSITNPEDFVKTNVLGTQILLDASLKKTSKGFITFQQMRCMEALILKIRTSLMNEQHIAPEVLIQLAKQAQIIW